MQTAQSTLVTRRVSLTLATCRLIGAAFLISAAMAVMLLAVGLLIDGQGLRLARTQALVGDCRCGPSATRIGHASGSGQRERRQGGAGRNQEMLAAIEHVGDRRGAPDGIAGLIVPEVRAGLR